MAISGEWGGRDNPCSLSLLPQARVNANLKASSRAQPAGVRHPLTSLPFFISALTSSVFFLETVLPREPTTQVRQGGSMNSHASEMADLLPLRQFITANPDPHTYPVYKTPPPFSHKFRNFRVAFPHLGFISRASC
jgi:hypothetical protein